MARDAAKVKSIFLAAVECHAAEQWPAYLDGACGDDPDLRGRVERLLGAHSEQRSLRVPSPSEAEDDVARLAVGAACETAGPYRLMDPIGEGGMGVVYIAEQTEPVRRKVALKVIRPGMDTRQVIARFEAERQALAMMDHPNIATVHDAGTTSLGRPYFVMELVQGLPITDYCDREQLPIRQRLELFVLVCRAVQHAHQKGIIHRDIKPSNVLVAVVDGIPVPKVIDFGVAKATGGSLSDPAACTGFTQLVGTPLYMSPEQVEMSGLDIDTRSDIYSLGVLLYELLTGTTPFDSATLGRAAFDEMRRIIREDDPPTPSTRLSSLRETLSTASTLRHTDPIKLGRSLRGEMDWVVMKALEKDRRRRYETASDFAADLMNVLTDRPVGAHPPSAWYRLTKFAHRNRAAVTSGALVGTALIVGTAIASWQAAQANIARQQAEDHLTEGLRAVEALYDHSASRGLTSLGASPMPRPFLLKVLPFFERYAAARRVDAASAGAYRRIGEILFQLGRRKEADSALVRSEALWRAMLAVEPENPGFQLELARCLADRGESSVDEKDQMRNSKEALSLRTTLADRFPGVPLHRRELAFSYDALARWHVWNRRPGAEEFLENALKLRERLAAESPNDPDTLCDLGESLRRFSEFHGLAYRAKEAAPYMRRSYAIADRLHSQHPTHPRYFQELVWAGIGYAGCLLEVDKNEAEAARIYEQTVTMAEGLVTDNPDQPTFLNNLLDALGYRAVALSRQGDQAKLDETIRRLLEHLDQWRSGDIMCHTAWSLCQSNIRAHAAPDVAVKLAREAYRRDPGNSLRNHVLAQALFRAGQWDEAIQEFLRTNDLEEGNYLCFNGFFIAMAYQHKGNEPRARSWYERSASWMAEHKPNDENGIRYRAEAAALLGVDKTKSDGATKPAKPMEVPRS